VRRHWHEIEVKNVDASIGPDIKVGSEIEVKARIYLSPLRPDDIRLDIYYGPLNTKAQITCGIAVPMNMHELVGDNTYLFKGIIPCMSSGRHGFVLRLLPDHKEFNNPYSMKLIKWI